MRSADSAKRTVVLPSGVDSAGRAPVPGAGVSRFPAIDSIAEFAKASRLLIGDTVAERPQWNNETTADAIRHFAWGISDDNPLWVDSDYAAAGPYGRLAAPPAFLFSVLYPILHGAPTSFPLNFLISGVECRWYLPILEGDRLTATSVHKEVMEGRDRTGRDIVYIVAETTYRNQADEVVGAIKGSLAAADKAESGMLLDRGVHEYSAEDLEALGTALRAEQRTGRKALVGLAIRPGDELPPIVRGPLTLGDLISWQSAIGPSYRAAALAYKDLLANPHTATVLPRVGWPVRYSQQHEDFTLAAQRGMPAPFDNGAMRAAWLSVLLTNWMGDSGVLRRMQVSTIKPVIYGDTNWYAGRVLRKLDAGDETLVTIRLTGTNQLGELTTTGEAEVAIPSRPRKSKGEAELPRQHPVIEWGRRDQRATPVTVCDLFEDQVRAQPRATAIVAGMRRLTYAELDAEANRMSHALAAQGIRPGSRLGLYLARTADVAVAVLACAKAGAAYVPLDRAYPKERLARMLEAAGVDHVLTEGGQFELDDSPRPTLLRLDAVMSSQQALPGDRAAARSTVDDAAYVLFTSGSTGANKAVTVHHAGLGQYLRSIMEALDVTAGDVCLHTASFSFSAAVRQYWLPLCIGATLVLTDEETRHRPLLLFEQVRRAGVTVWDTVPSILEFAIESLRGLDERKRAALLDNRLRRVFTTGEPLKWSTARAWRTLPGNRASIVNLYSQTETVGTVCVYPVPDEDHAQAGIVPLGRPVSNTGICLLDEELQPVAEGEIGEICVASGRLASGYADRPGLEAEKFVRIALPDGTEQRLFRTGDLGRRGIGGVLECLGRADDQIKIRGLQVRLGEVESAIRRDPRVEHCVVVGIADVAAADGVRLIAYVVPGAGKQIDTGELRAWLARWLPDYALPSAVVLLDALPRNPNGKVDRSALPRPGPETLTRHTARIAPRDAKEELIAAIWRKFLGVDDVGVHDDFFELGGHSLLATRVVTHVCHQTGIELSLLDFFDNPTIAGLAGLFAKVSKESDSTGRAAVGGVVPDVIPRRSSGRGASPLSPAQARIWIVEQLNHVGPAAFNIPRLVAFDGELDPRILNDSINLIISRHEVLRARFEMQNGQLVQVIGADIGIELPIVDLSALDPQAREAELARQGCELGARRLDLAVGPPLRCWLFRLGPRRHALLVVMHHIVSDGWSTGIFMHELTSAYGALAAGTAPGLPELNIQYPDFAAWQLDWLAGGVADRQLAYWKQRLAEPLPILDLPSDRPRPPVQSLLGAQEPVVIDAVRVAAMERICRAEGATLFMGMLATFNALLYRYTGQHELVIGIPIANRRHAWTEGLIGVFINMLPIRTSIQGDASFLALLRQVRAVTLEAFANQDLPFDVLVKELRPQRDSSRSPLFQVVFAMQNMPRAPTIEGVAVTLPKIDNGTAKFDLTLQLFPYEGGRLNGFVEYSTTLFDRVTIRRLIGHLNMLLQSVTDRPEWPIGHPARRTAEERTG